MVRQCGQCSRETLAKHPWSMGGGGITELKEQMESCKDSTLKHVIESVGFMAITVKTTFRSSEMALKEMDCLIVHSGLANYPRLAV
jgi:hypothetical protein